MRPKLKSIDGIPPVRRRFSAAWFVGAMARYVPALLLGALVVGTGCTSERETLPPYPSAVPTPAPIAWQRAQVAIGLDTFDAVHLTGLMQLHQRTVNAVAFSQSGTRLASVGADRVVAVWNLANGESLFARGSVDGRYVYFGPADQSLVTVDRDGAALVWSLDMAPPRTLDEIAHFAGYTSVAEVVAQSHDHALLAFGSRTGAIRVWRVAEVRTTATMPASGGAVQDLVFSPDDMLLASINSERNVRIWSMPDGAPQLDLTDTTLVPLRAAFSPDSRQLAVSMTTGIRIWNTHNGDLLHSIDYPSASTLIYSPDGALLAGCGAQSTIGVWDAASGDLLARLPLPEQNCHTLAFSPDGMLLLVLPTPGRDVYLWDLSHVRDDVPLSDKPLRRRTRADLGLLPGSQFYDAAWSPDGRFIILLDERGPLYALSAAP